MSLSVIGWEQTVPSSEAVSDAASVSLPQIDTSEADLSDEKVLDQTYSEIEEDTFQASMIALHGSSCSSDMDYVQSSTPKVGGFLSTHFEIIPLYLTNCTFVHSLYFLKMCWKIDENEDCHSG